MSFRVDSSLIPGAFVVGNSGLGVLGSQIASTGDYGPGYCYGDLSLPADANKEIRGFIEVPPTGLTYFYAYEDTSFIATGPDGTYSLVKRVYEDGIDDGTKTVFFTIGTVVPAGSIGWTEANDTATITGSMRVIGTASWTEADDVLTAFGPPAVQTSQSAGGDDTEEPVEDVRAFIRRISKPKPQPAGQIPEITEVTESDTALAAESAVSAVPAAPAESAESTSARPQADTSHLGLTPTAAPATPSSAPSNISVKSITPEVDHEVATPLPNPKKKNDDDQVFILLMDLLDRI